MDYDAYFSRIDDSVQLQRQLVSMSGIQYRQPQMGRLTTSGTIELLGYQTVIGGIPTIPELLFGVPLTQGRG